MSISEDRSAAGGELLLHHVLFQGDVLGQATFAGNTDLTFDQRFDVIQELLVRGESIFTQPIPRAPGPSSDQRMFELLVSASNTNFVGDDRVNV